MNMLCDNCKKLSILSARKKCIRCQAEVSLNISALCEFCSATEKQCSACLKKVISTADRSKTRGCGCGKK